MARPSCEHPLTSLLPEEVVDKIAWMALEPHPTAKLINSLVFEEWSVEDWDWADRVANGCAQRRFVVRTANNAPAFRARWAVPMVSLNAPIYSRCVNTHFAYMEYMPPGRWDVESSSLLMGGLSRRHFLFE